MLKPFFAAYVSSDATIHQHQLPPDKTRGHLGFIQKFKKPWEHRCCKLSLFNQVKSRTDWLGGLKSFESTVEASSDMECLTKIEHLAGFQAAAIVYSTDCPGVPQKEFKGVLITIGEVQSFTQANKRDLGRCPSVKPSTCLGGQDMNRKINSHMEFESSKSHILSPPSRWQTGFGQMGLA